MPRLSTKPYLLRALYEWCVDCGFTPHIVAWVNEQTQVPMQYVKDNEIVLNIGPAAANQLTIDDEWVHFAARFSGVPHDIWIPVGHVASIFARETGEGMSFEVEPVESGHDDEEGHLSLVDTPATDTPTEKDVSQSAVTTEDIKTTENTNSDTNKNSSLSPKETQNNNAPAHKKGLRIVK